MTKFKHLFKVYYDTKLIGFFYSNDKAAHRNLTVFANTKKINLNDDNLCAVRERQITLGQGWGETTETLRVKLVPYKFY